MIGSGSGAISIKTMLNVTKDSGYSKCQNKVYNGDNGEGLEVLVGLSRYSISREVELYYRNNIQYGSIFDIDDKFIPVAGRMLRMTCGRTIFLMVCP